MRSRRRSAAARRAVGACARCGAASGRRGGAAGTGPARRRIAACTRSRTARRGRRRSRARSGWPPALRIASASARRAGASPSLAMDVLAVAARAAVLGLITSSCAISSVVRAVRESLATSCSRGLSGFARSRSRVVHEARRVRIAGGMRTAPAASRRLLAGARRRARSGYLLPLPASGRQSARLHDGDLALPGSLLGLVVSYRAGSRLGEPEELVGREDQEVPTRLSGRPSGPAAAGAGPEAVAASPRRRAPPARAA